MARNSENAPSEPSGRRRNKAPEGASALRQQFRDSIRDALAGVDVDALQGRPTLPVPSDVSLLTREAVSDLEAELAKLRAERAELERRAQARAAGGGVAAVAVVEEALPRWGWRRGRIDAAPEVAEDAEAQAPPVPWSPERAKEPVGGVSEKPRSDRKSAPDAPSPAESSAPAESPAALNPIATQDTNPATAPQLEAAPVQSRTPLTDSELELVVAPLLAELANLRTEVRQLRGDPDAATSLRPGSNRQLVRLILGIFLGFALIVAALAVVLKA
jgi:hypothetical protein